MCEQPSKPAMRVRFPSPALLFSVLVSAGFRVFEAVLAGRSTELRAINGPLADRHHGWDLATGSEGSVPVTCAMRWSTQRTHGCRGRWSKQLPAGRGDHGPGRDACDQGGNQSNHHNGVRGGTRGLVAVSHSSASVAPAA